MTDEARVVNEAIFGAQQPKRYFGRFVRKQGAYGSVAVVGMLSGTTVEYIADPKRRFAKDGTVETRGVVQHAGLSPGDWMEFSVSKNTRHGAAEYKVAYLRRIPRYAELPAGNSDAFYKALLTRAGWRGDRRAGLWALRLPENRVIIAELETSADGALRIPRGDAMCVKFYDFVAGAVARLDASSPVDLAYLDNSVEPIGTFDWSDDFDHVSRVIRSLAEFNDPHISDLITWLELHFEQGADKVFNAHADHKAELNALRSGELAERLRADRDLMKLYLDAALGDSAVASAVAEYAREGHTEARSKLLMELENEVAGRKAQLIAEQEEGLAEERRIAEARLGTEIEQLRSEMLSEVENAIRQAESDHNERVAQLDTEYTRRQQDLEHELGAAGAELVKLKDSIASAASDLEIALDRIETERARALDATVEVDRLLSVSQQLSQKPSAAGLTGVSSVPFAFPNRELVSIKSLSVSIDGLAILSPKGRHLLRRLLVLMLSGEVPILFGTDALDFVRLAGAVVTPSRVGFMRADATLISIEDVWSRPGSGAPTVMAAASSAAIGGGSVLVAVTDIESSGARFWLPALAEFLRSQARPRGLLVCAVAGDIAHDEVMSLPRALATLEIEGAFEPGAFYGALALPHVTGAQELSLDPGITPPCSAAVVQCIADLEFEPNIGLVIRIARIFAEALAMLGDDVAASKLAVEIAKDINKVPR
jgi:hypothetical protein